MANQTSVKLSMAIAGAFMLGGCAMSPGFYMDESKLHESALPGQVATTDNAKYEVTTVTPTLIARQNTALMQEEAPSGNPALAATLDHYRYTIEPDDILNITVFNHPELAGTTSSSGPMGSLALLGNHQELAQPALAAGTETSGSTGASGYLVTKNGTFVFPFIGQVQAAGKTTNQIRAQLDRALAPYIRNPQVFVQVAAYRSQKASIAGEVKKPGVLPITDLPMTAERAIQLAEGTTPEADLRNVTLVRAGQTYRLNLQKFYDHGDLSQNVLLRNGDTLQVPDRSQNKIYVLGEVNKSGAYQMNKGRMTLTEAIGDSGGFTTASNPSKIYVVRGNVAHPTIYRLDGRAPDAMLMASQFQLQPKDVVIVSPSEISRWSRVMGEILPSLSGVVLGTQLK